MTHSKPTISLVVIHRRAGNSLARSVLSAIAEVDEVVLIDTGPADDGPDARRARAEIESILGPACVDHGVRLIHSTFYGPEFLFDGQRFTADFSAARNFAHGRASCDWHLMLDSDDQLHASPDAPPLRELIAETLVGHLGVGEFAMRYRYGAGISQDRVRLWRRHFAWEWRGALHEERVALAGNRHTRCQIPEELWFVEHRGDAKASAARNAALLRHMWERDREREFTPQMVCAFAAVLLDARDPEAVIRSLAMPDESSRPALSLWHSLRAEAYNRLGCVADQLAELGAALALAPKDRARWVELGLAWARQEEHAAAFAALNLGFNQLPQEDWVYLAPTAWFEGEALQEAQAYVLSQERLKEKAVILKAKRVAAQPREAAPNRIDFLVASPAVGWGPWTNKVVGGSELAMIELAPRLAKLGLDVHVWALGLAPTAAPGEGSSWSASDGETWHELEDFDPAEPRAAVVVWRDTRRIAGCQGFGYPVWLWAHDIPEAYGAEGLHLADKVFALSEHHALRFASLGVDSAKIVRSANGLNALEVAAAQFMNSESGIIRDSHRAVYCSAANRGLLLLLEMWPAVRDAVPDATLEVCYGLELFERADTPPRLRGLAAGVRAKCKELADEGVTLREAVPHGELLRLLGSAGVWAYPCIFEEIFCIAAIEAQAMGAWPVTTDSAALAETVRGGFKMPLRQLQDDCGLSEEEQALGEVWSLPLGVSNTFLDKLVVAMLEPPDEEARANLSQTVLCAYNWDTVAACFAAALKEVPCGAKVEQGVLPQEVPL